jgi:hypothetical protein
LSIFGTLINKKLKKKEKRENKKIKKNCWKKIKKRYNSEKSIP